MNNHVMYTRCLATASGFRVYNVIHNKYICAVGDRYRWSIIGNLQRLIPQRTATKRIIARDSEFYLKKRND